MHEVARGGDVTYHGPGQLVGYPIVDLGARTAGRARVPLRDLEDVIVRCSRLRRAGGRVAGCPAAGSARGEDRLDRRRLARLGHAGTASRSTSTTDLAGFDAIVPCGIRDASVAGLTRLLGRPVATEEVMDHLQLHFEAVFAAPAVAAAS